MAQKIEIFKPGTHTTMHGETIRFTEDDLRTMAEAYDPQLFEAPLVVGHPKHDLPAYGWVKAVEFVDGVLRVEPDQVEPQFAEMVRAGRFKKVSARFYRPDAADNPRPGTWYLRHVGFLGAAAPAVKGLKSASFSADEAGTVTVEFGDWIDEQNASLFRRLREWIIGKFGQDEADRALPGYIVEEIEREARREPATVAAGPQFSEPTDKENGMTKEQLEQQKKELEKQQAEFAERQRQLAQREEQLARQAAETRKAEAVAFCDDMVKQGRLLPAHKERMVAFMTSLSPEASVEFGEGDGKKTESQLTAFKALVQSLPQTIDFGERAGTEIGDPPSRQDTKDVAFSADLTACV